MTFDPRENYLLENQRALLRPLEQDDAAHLIRFGLEEPELWTYTLQNAGSEPGMKTYIQAALKLKENGRTYPFIVYDKVSGAYAGSTRLYDIDLAGKNLSLGYTWYGKKFQGTGLNKHCKYLLFEFIFEQLGFERVEFRLDSRNERSMNAIKNLGCSFEGVLRSNGYRNDGSRRDSAVWSLLKSEWFDFAKTELKAKCF